MKQAPKAAKAIGQVVIDLDVPESVTADAAVCEAWNQTVEKLASRGLLRAVDVETIEAYALASVGLGEAHQRVRRDGLTVEVPYRRGSKTGRTRRIVNPALRDCDFYSSAMTRLGRMLGLWQ